MPPRGRQKTLQFFSEGNAIVTKKSLEGVPPQSGETLKLPGLTSEKAAAVLADSVNPPHEPNKSDIRIKTLNSDPEIKFSEIKESTVDHKPAILTNETIEALLNKPRPEIPETDEEYAETVTPSRPALLDLPPYRAPEPALLELAPYEPTTEIEQRRSIIGNKARVAIAIGVGAAIGLAGTAIYKEYSDAKVQKTQMVNPVPEKSSL